MSQDEWSVIEGTIISILDTDDGLSPIAVHVRMRAPKPPLQSVIDVLRDLSRRGIVQFAAGKYSVQGAARATAPPRAAVFTTIPGLTWKEPPMAQKPTTQEAILSSLPGTLAEVIKRTKLSKQSIYLAASVMKRNGTIKKVGRQWVRVDGVIAPAPKPAPIPEFLKPFAPMEQKYQNALRETLGFSGVIAKLKAQRDKIDKAIEALTALVC